jgi:hypothetical protein
MFLRPDNACRADAFQSPLLLHLRCVLRRDGARPAC